MAFVCLFASVIIHPPETRGMPLVQFMFTGVMVVFAISGLTLAASIREAVRKLADRSATATREIKEMVERVEEGIGQSGPWRSSGM